MKPKKKVVILTESQVKSLMDNLRLEREIRKFYRRSGIKFLMESNHRGTLRFRL